MEITWLGHSCFRFKGKEATLIADPYDESIGYVMGGPVANIVTLSHHHPGHSCAAQVGNSPKVFGSTGEYEVSDVFIVGMKTFHDSEQGSKRGKNTVYIIDMDDIRICHLGDLGHMLSSQQVGELGGVEVLLIPVGGVSTIDARTATEIVRLLSPMIVIPMHYNTEVTTWLDPVDKFFKEMGLRGVEPQPKLNVTRSNMPSETKVVLLEYQQRQMQASAT